MRAGSYVARVLSFAALCSECTWRNIYEKVPIESANEFRTLVQYSTAGPLQEDKRQGGFS